jgi:hypothetical protein
MTDSALRENAGRSFLVRGLTAGLAIHAASAAVFFILDRLRLEGCDRGDGAFGALVFATMADLVFGGLVTAVLLKRGRSGGRGILAGVAISYSAVALMCVLGTLYANSFGSGCPV